MSAKLLRFRNLRIAWTVGWGLLAAILIVLNVWSCWWWDRCYVPGNRLGVQINSDAGHVVLMIGPSEPTVNKVILGHLPSSGPADVFYDNDILGFYFKREPASLRLDTPYWFIVIVVVVIAASLWVPWCSKRFSLRAMLIATTLVAVVLGLIAWLRLTSRVVGNYLSAAIRHSIHAAIGSEIAVSTEPITIPRLFPSAMALPKANNADNTAPQNSTRTKRLDLSTLPPPSRSVF